MKRSLVLIGLLLLVALSVGGYLWHRRQPASQINRTVDQLLDTVAYKKISLRDPAETRESLRKILAEEISLSGLPVLRDQKVSRDTFLGYVETFHSFTTLCEFSEIERQLRIEGREAQAYRTTTVIHASGPDSRTEQNWKLTFDLQKQDRWRITGVQASPMSE